jgi:hypothetical protein
VFESTYLRKEEVSQGRGFIRQEERRATIGRRIVGRRQGGRLSFRGRVSTNKEVLRLGNGFVAVWPGAKASIGG